MLLAERPEVSRYDLSSVKEVLCGAAPLSAQLRKRVSGDMGIIIREGYGMTELTCGALKTTMKVALEGYCLPSPSVML